METDISYNLQLISAFSFGVMFFGRETNDRDKALVVYGRIFGHKLDQSVLRLAENWKCERTQLSFKSSQLKSHAKKAEHNH